MPFNKEVLDAYRKIITRDIEARNIVLTGSLKAGGPITIGGNLIVTGSISGSTYQNINITLENHAASHYSGSTDPVSLDASQIGSGTFPAASIPNSLPNKDVTYVGGRYPGVNPGNLAILDADSRVRDSNKLEGQTLTEVQNHAPQAHASTHSGSDPVTIYKSQIVDIDNQTLTAPRLSITGSSVSIISGSLVVTGSISGSSIQGAYNITDLTATTVTGSSVVSGSNVYGANAKFTTLNATSGTIPTLSATSLTGSTISEQDATITNVNAIYVTGSTAISGSNIYATAGRINTLTSTDVNSTRVSSTYVTGSDTISGSTGRFSNLYITGTISGATYQGQTDIAGKISVSKNTGPVIGTERLLNFIEGPGVTFTIVGDPTDQRVDIQAAASGTPAKLVPSYTIYSGSASGGPYFAQDDAGNIDYSGSNATTVISSAVTALTNGGLIFIKQGTYYLNGDITCNISYLEFRGEGWATHLRISGSSGFVVTGTTTRYGPFFENLYFDGEGNADYAINTQARTAGVQDGFYLNNCYFTGFTKAGSVPLKLRNLDRSTINANFFSAGTNTEYILLDSYAYIAGNVDITDNFFNISGSLGGTTCAIYIDGNSDESGQSKSLGRYKVERNHFFNFVNSNNCYGVAVYAVKDDVDQISITNNRCEYSNLVATSGSVSSVRKMLIAENVVYNNRNPHVSINFTDANIKDCIISGNYIQGSNGLWFSDSGSSTSQYNTWENNSFIDSDTFFFTHNAIVRNNRGLNPLGKATTYRNSGNQIYCYTGSNANPGSKNLDYEIRTTDCYINAYGGTDINITIKDKPSGNIIRTGLSSLDGQFLKRGMAFSWTGSSNPTLEVYFE